MAAGLGRLPAQERLHGAQQEYQPGRSAKLPSTTPHMVASSGVHATPLATSRVRSNTRGLTTLLLQEGFRPAKYFSIDRVFRNEAIDRTHLAEFHQIEGEPVWHCAAASCMWRNWLMA